MTAAVACATFCCNMALMIQLHQTEFSFTFEFRWKLWQLCKVFCVFEHKMQYLLIHAPITCVVIFWHIGNVPQMFHRVKFVVMPPRLYSSNICEILLYNWQWVVITHDLICGVGAAYHKGKNLCEMGLLEKDYLPYKPPHHYVAVYPG